MSQDNVFVYNDDINKPKIYKPYYLFTLYIHVHNFKFIYFLYIYTSGVKGRGEGVWGHSFDNPFLHPPLSHSSCSVPQVGWV